jgi:hypothetical protein
MISHGGGINGFTCYSLWLPDQDIYIAVLTNGATQGPGPTTVAKTIAAMFVGDPYPARKAATLDESDLSGLAGKYVGENFPPVEISADDGEIVMSIAGSGEDPVYAESRNLLFLKDSLGYIEVDWDGGKASELRYFYEEGVPPAAMRRVE